DGVYTSITDAVGHTPLVALPFLSRLTGCRLFGKCEFLNPGGSSKDRVALGLVLEAERRGRIRPHAGHTLVEGTVGSTGIALAMVARARGYRCVIVMPDDVSRDKSMLLRKLGADVRLVRPAPIVHPNHFVNVARQLAEDANAAALKRRHAAPSPSLGEAAVAADHVLANCDDAWFFVDQFENTSNFAIHRDTTAVEIHRQLRGQRLDVLVMGAGTGGTLAGLTHYLKPRRPELRVCLADPQGSGLFNKVVHGVMYSPYEAEGTRRRHQSDTVVEGMGLTRLTANFEQLMRPCPPLPAPQHAAASITDQEAVTMARLLVQREGLFLGSTSAVNVMAAVRQALHGPPGAVIVTILCDAGQRYLGRFWDDDYL
ncbi:hypothetical protein CXG81DRAFT_5540, partial [Caulochytrium protostelioides]